MNRPLLTLLLAFVAACAQPPGEESVEERPDVVLFLVDTLRADRLGAYGNSRPVSPRFDAFAAEGVLFEHAYAPAPWTLPSTAALITGVHPLRHGAGLESVVPSGTDRSLGAHVATELALEIPTLAQRLGADGYRCEAVVANPYVHFGIERGFEHYELRLTEAAEVVQHALDRRAIDDPRPLFLLVHVMDCHDPLLVPTEYVFDVEPGEAPPLWLRELSLLPPDPESVDQRTRLYDASIRYVDTQFGRLLDGLEAHARGEKTIVAFASDHGEELFDSALLARDARYRFVPGFQAKGHGHTLFEELLHVPLAVRIPGGPSASIATAVQLHDVAPTLLELCGHDMASLDFEFNAQVDGRSLTAALAGAEPAPRGILAGALAYGPERRAWIQDGFEFIRGAEGELDLLLALHTEERVPIVDAARSAEFERALADAEASLVQLEGEPRTTDSLDGLDPATRARLEAVGYLDGE